MKHFVLYCALFISFTFPTFADAAWCSWHPNRVYPTRQEALAHAIESATRNGKDVTTVFCHQRVASYIGPYWACENKLGECDEQERAESQYLQQMQDYRLPSGEGWYQVWPGGDVVYCDHSYGCRRMQ